MGRARQLLTLLSGGRSANWLFRDYFLSDIAAGSLHGTPATPGPGTRTVVDSASRLSIAGGKLVKSGAVASSFSDPRYVSTASYERVPGLALFSSVTQQTGNQFMLGWYSAATGGIAPTFASYLTGVSGYRARYGAADIILRPSNVTGVLFPSAIVLRQTGAFLFVKDSGVWRLLWVDASSTTSPLWATIIDGGSDYTTENLGIRQLGSPFNSDFGLASLNVATPSGLFDASANAVIDITIATPGSLTTDVGIKFRISDANNYWIMYISSSGAFRLDSVVAGTPTNRINVAGVISGGQTRTLRCVMHNSLLNCYTFNGTTATKQGSEINVSHNSAATGLEIIGAVGYTVSDLRVYPGTSVIYDELDR